MADESQLELIKRGTQAWNDWRRENQSVPIDLTNAHLGDIKLPKVDLRSASLDGIRLRWAYMREAQLSGATLTRADLRIIDLSKANLQGANLRKAHLDGAYLKDANLDGADLYKASLLGVNFDRVSLKGASLEGANLRNAVLVDVDLTQANLDECRVYGASVWNVNTTATKQQNLIITRDKEPKITVDNLKVAQFIYLLLNNQEIRDVIDTITSKMVLILGRFTNERKRVLDAMREALRSRDYLPVLFDFEKPAHRNLTETISTLAHMARFVIADITDAKSIPQELMRIVPGLPNLPVQPLLLATQHEYGMFESIRDYPWVLELFRYDNEAMLLTALTEKVIRPAEAKAKELESKKKGTS